MQEQVSLIFYNLRHNNNFNSGLSVKVGAQQGTNRISCTKMHLRGVVQHNNKLQQAALHHTSHVSDLEAGMTNGFHNSSKIFVKYF